MPLVAWHLNMPHNSPKKGGGVGGMHPPCSHWRYCAVFWAMVMVATLARPSGQSVGDAQAAHGSLPSPQAWVWGRGSTNSLRAVRPGLGGADHAWPRGAGDEPCGGRGGGRDSRGVGGGVSAGEGVAEGTREAEGEGVGVQALPVDQAGEGGRAGPGERSCV